MKSREVALALKTIKDKKRLILSVIYSKKCEAEENDIIQDLFITLVENPIPRHIKSKDSYLRRLIINDIFDMFRKRKREQLKIHSFSENRQKTINDNLSSIMIEEEVEFIFRLANKKLPSYLYKPFILRYKHEFSIEEISGKLGINKNIVRVYLSNATKKMRFHLKAKLYCT